MITQISLPSRSATRDAGYTPFRNDQVYPGLFTVLGPIDQGSHSAARIIREHPPGATISAWYLPDDPQTAFLKPVRIVYDGLFVIVAAMLTMAGGGFLPAQFGLGLFTRLSFAVGLGFYGLFITWLLWIAYVIAPSVQVVGDIRMLEWLLLAFAVEGWTIVISYAPRQLAQVREATFASVFFGTTAMSLSLFVLLPVTFLAPQSNAMQWFSWIGVGAAIFVLGLWMCGLVSVGKPKP